MGGIFEQITAHLGPNTVLTDVGSVKAEVVGMARRALGGAMARFVPAHPIAGTEQSGVGASFAELFEGRLVLLTPTDETSHAAIDRVQRMWEAVGATVMSVDVQHHDEVLAATSHLPHLLAYTLVDTLARMDDSDEIFRFAAGGFRDFTRIASSDPQMWHDICMANRIPLLAMLERFEAELDRLRKAIAEGDGEYVKATFIRAKRARDTHAPD